MWLKCVPREGAFVEKSVIFLNLFNFENLKICHKKKFTNSAILEENATRTQSLWNIYPNFTPRTDFPPLFLESFWLFSSKVEDWDHTIPFNFHCLILIWSPEMDWNWWEMVSVRWPSVPWCYQLVKWKDLRDEIFETFFQLFKRTAALLAHPAVSQKFH